VRNLVVKRLALLVEASQAPARQLLDDRRGHGRTAVHVLGQIGGQFQQIERAPRITVRGTGEQVAQRLRHVQLDCPETDLAVDERPIDERTDVAGVERLEHVHTRPRQQRLVEFERRILGGRADEGQCAVLDVRQEPVLLRLVETVHLVHEQHRGLVALAAQAACLVDRGADLLHARKHRRQRDEVRLQS
jgi:hypothetical protein